MRAGLSQRELARLSGLSHSFISLLESGKRKGLNINTIKKLAKALDVPLVEMLS